jgi:hypothetical protein
LITDFVDLIIELLLERDVSMLEVCLRHLQTGMENNWLSLSDSVGNATNYSSFVPQSLFFTGNARLKQ